jgi:hypothetical protein
MAQRERDRRWWERGGKRSSARKLMSKKGIPLKYLSILKKIRYWFAIQAGFAYL